MGEGGENVELYGDERERRRTKWSTVPIMLLLAVFAAIEGPSWAAGTFGFMAGLMVACPSRYYR